MWWNSFNWASKIFQLVKTEIIPSHARRGSLCVSEQGRKRIDGPFLPHNKTHYFSHTIFHEFILWVISLSGWDKTWRKWGTPRNSIWLKFRLRFSLMYNFVPLVKMFTAPNARQEGTFSSFIWAAGVILTGSSPLTLSHLTSPHLNSSHLTSPPLTSPLDSASVHKEHLSVSLYRCRKRCKTGVLRVYNIQFLHIFFIAPLLFLFIWSFYISG